MLYPVELRAHTQTASQEGSGKKAGTLMKLYRRCKPPKAGNKAAKRMHNVGQVSLPVSEIDCLSVSLAFK